MTTTNGETGKISLVVAHKDTGQKAYITSLKNTVSRVKTLFKK